MKQLDFIGLAGGKTIGEAIAILRRIQRRHPDARMVVDSEWDYTALHIEWPRVRKVRPRPVGPPSRPRVLTPLEQFVEDAESKLLWQGAQYSVGFGLAYWLSGCSPDSKK
jgi:hypothetical protein